MQMPWWAWALIGIVTGGVVAYVWIGLYLSKAFRQ
jgi:hypothetical protein